MAFTADADGSEMRHLRDAGFDGVIAKPILPSVLVRQISDMLTEGHLHELMDVRHA